MRQDTLSEGGGVRRSGVLGPDLHTGRRSGAKTRRLGKRK